MTKCNRLLKVKILAVLKKHPGGMDLRNLGNILGVNWRSLLIEIGCLLNKGKIEKLNGHCFIVNASKKITVVSDDPRDKSS